MSARLWVGSAAVAAAMLGAGCGAPHEPPEPARLPNVASLSDLSIQSLRAREYGTTLIVEEKVDAQPFESYLASYDSDGLRLYTRVDIPGAPAPETGHPVVIFVHGWRGIDDAPSLEFYYAEDSYYHKAVNAYREAGFVVFTPGLRGHGTIKGVPAEGIEFMAAYDNGSYLSPVFYAIDVLNLVSGLTTFPHAVLDLDRVNLTAHSQGGDAVLIAAAVAGEGARAGVAIDNATIWAGTFASRFTQLETYAPMQQSQEAFLAGDGTWTGTAVGADGTVNPNFVFGYPPEWIATPHVAEWTWQHETWSAPTVADVWATKLDQMYGAINEYVGDIDNAVYRLDRPSGARAVITHDPRVSKAMAQIGAFDQAEFLTEPLALQHSDRDLYSPSPWNADLCRRVNAAGGRCYDFEYVGNTHSLGVSEQSWFSDEETVAGFDLAVRRDVALFSGQDPTTLR